MHGSYYSALLKERIWVVLTLKVFADESGTHDETGQKPGSEVAGVLGYLAWNWQWENLVRQWNGFLTAPAYGVTDFHMTEFMRGKALPYRTWSHVKRGVFRRGLTEIVTANTALGVGGLLVVADYKKLMPASLYVPPYLFCFQLLFDTILKRVEELPGLMATDQIAFVFDNQQQFKAAAQDAFDRIKEARDPRDRMGSITFSTRQQDPELQSADMIAWTILDGITRHVQGLSRRKWVKDLGKLKNMRMGYYDKENLAKVIPNILAKQKRD